MHLLHQVMIYQGWVLSSSLLMQVALISAKIRKEVSVSLTDHDEESAGDEVIRYK